MEDELVDWWNVTASAAVSFLVAVIVGVIIRFKLKPKHEEVFEHNRNVNLMMVFGILSRLDFQFEGFITIFEQRMGEFTEDRKRILPEVKWKMDSDGGQIADMSSSTEIFGRYEDVKNDLKPFVKNMNDIHKQLGDDYNIFQNYIHADFLRDVDLYIFNTCYFAEWALKDAPIPKCLISRMKFAKKIIKYVEDDKTVELTFPTISEFIKRWKEEFRKFDN